MNPAVEVVVSYYPPERRIEEEYDNQLGWTFVVSSCFGDSSFVIKREREEVLFFMKYLRGHKEKVRLRVITGEDAFLGDKARELEQIAINHNQT
jgi:hypothetical protein